MMTNTVYHVGILCEHVVKDGVNISYRDEEPDIHENVIVKVKSPTPNV